MTGPPREALPGPGEVPFWQGPLAPITEALDLADWDQGGCLAFAEALAAATGGELYGFCTFDEGRDGEEGDWPVEHAVVRVGDAFYDYKGLVDVEAGLSLYGRSKPGVPVALKARTDEGVSWFEDEFLGDVDYAELCRVLAEGFGQAPGPARPS